MFSVDFLSRSLLDFLTSGTKIRIIKLSFIVLSDFSIKSSCRYLLSIKMDSSHGLILIIQLIFGSAGNLLDKLYLGCYRFLFIEMCILVIALLLKGAQSAGAVEYTNCKSTPMSVLDITLNNLMVRLQLCWSSGECKSTLAWSGGT